MRLGVDPRRWQHVIFFFVLLPLVSWGLAWLTGRTVDAFVPEDLSFAVDALGPLGWFGALWASFDAWAWRWTVWRNVGVVEIPDFSGYWSGEFESSFASETGQVVGASGDCRLKVIQAFSHVSVNGQFALSRSWSAMAGVVVATDGRVELHYGYLNEVSASATRSMQSHAGYCRLWMANGGVDLLGEYFTNSRQDRPNYGSISARKVR